MEAIAVSGDFRVQCGPAAEAGAALDATVREAQPQPRLAAAGEEFGTGLSGGGSRRRGHSGARATDRTIGGEGCVRKPCPHARGAKTHRNRLGDGQLRRIPGTARIERGFETNTDA